MSKSTNKSKSNKLLMLIGTLNIILLLVLIVKTKSPIINVNATKVKEKPSKPQVVESKTPTKKDNFVFLGDSITDWYPIDELYDSSIPIVNSGVAGYTTRDILDKLEEMVYIYNPTKVFILIGTNDLNADIKEEETIDNIRKILENIKKNRSKTKIYLESIYPINRSNDKTVVMGTVGKRKNEDIRRINEELESICKELNVEFIDMYRILEDSEENLKIRYTRDGLHLNDMGYYKITEELKKYL